MGELDGRLRKADVRELSRMIQISYVQTIKYTS